MKLRCPVCHASNSLEAFTADDAGRELLVLLASTGPLFRPLVAYLGLFRPASRDLSHDRALRLAREVVDLGADPRAMAAALAEPVGDDAVGQAAIKEILERLKTGFTVDSQGGK